MFPQGSTGEEQNIWTDSDWAGEVKSRRWSSGGMFSGSEGTMQCGLLERARELPALRLSLDVVMPTLALTEGSDESRALFCREI